MMWGSTIIATSLFITIMYYFIDRINKGTFFSEDKFFITI